MPRPHAQELDLLSELGQSGSPLPRGQAVVDALAQQLGTSMMHAILLSCLAWVPVAQCLRPVPRRAVLAGGATMFPSLAWADTPDAKGEFLAAAGLRGGPVLNADGEFVDEDGADWKEEWKKRADKASTMTADEILMAARGAGNAQLREGPESDVSKRRRALAACRDNGLRRKAGAGETPACTKRVLDGEVDFMLKVLDQ